MNPGLVVKLRPAGPWRIGPDSGARNRVDVIYHSDSLYSAVTSAMARLGSMDAWLDATVRRDSPAVCFSSCFPFLDEIGFVVPPRTVWPPVSRALVAARVRWKSARFVPLGVVQAILAGQRLDDNHWTVDGPSECLVPAGRPGPFLTGVRWSAAVDRLTGSTERHSTACIEFRPGAGLWTIVSFVDESAHARWLDPIKAAFRLLADTGFGGERSRGWGRAESPEFIDGTLPAMILPPPEPDTEQAPVGQIVTGQPTEDSASPVAEPPPEGQVVTSQPTEDSASSATEQPPVGQVVTGQPTEDSASSAAEPPPEGQVVTGQPTEDSASSAAEQAPVGQIVTALPTEDSASSAAEQPPVGQIVTGQPTEDSVSSAAEQAPVEQIVTDQPTEDSASSAGEQPPEGQVVTGQPREGPTRFLTGEPVAEPAKTPEPATGAADPTAARDPLPERPEGLVEGPTEATAAVRAPSDLEPLVGRPPLPPAEPEPPAPNPALDAGPSTTEPTPPLPEPEPGIPEPASVEAPPEPPAEPIAAPAPGPRPPAPDSEAPPPSPQPTPAAHPHWLLSLFTPAPGDAVDWRRGNYTVLARGGRVDSPAGSGELKKQIQMVAEGSVVYAPTGPCGAAADVAPDGFAHPVFRAGFAVSIPLPEVS